jgi:hypothetical protein
MGKRSSHTRSSHKRSSHKRSSHKRSSHKRSSHKRSSHKRNSHKRSSHKRTTRKHHRNGGGLSPLSPGVHKSRKMKKKQRNYLDRDEFPLRFVTSKKLTKMSVVQERAREEREKLEQEKKAQRARAARVDFFINNTPLGRHKKLRRKTK